MTTKRKSELHKASGDMMRATSRFMRALPMVTRVNWRNVVMPWRMIPAPVALALIALVALAMVLDNGDDVAASSADVTIGADTVAPGTSCEEDEVIGYLVLLGGEGVGCIHYEYIVMEFIGDCLIGNSQYGDNLASYHLRDQGFGSWCNDVVDDASDGTMSLNDLIVDTAYNSEVSSTVAITPTVSPGMATITPTATMRAPVSLPNTGSR